MPDHLGLCVHRIILSIIAIQAVKWTSYLDPSYHFFNQTRHLDGNYNCWWGDVERKLKGPENKKYSKEGKYETWQVRF